MGGLKAFVGILEGWAQRHNLMSRASVAEVWRRHIWDSTQLVDFIPASAVSLVDLGSGAGFPGLVLAILLHNRGCRTVLYEATRNKCQILATAAQRSGIDAEIRNARLESAEIEPFDVITARACAPLPRLLAYAQPFQARHTRNLFLKGQSVASELTEAHKSWKMRVEQHASRSDPSGKILVIEDLRHAS